MQTISKLFGGFTLKKGDNDKKKIWYGKHHTSPGKHVALLQEELKKIGVYLNKIDGDFGRHTHEAVKRFQWNAKNIKNRIKDKSIISAITTYSDKIDGIVGKNTKNELAIWINNKYITTGDLVRVKATKLNNIDLADGFKKISHPSISNGELVVSSELIEYLKNVDKKAKELSLNIKLNQTMRVNGTKVSSAVVTPATKSQHLIGHAFDCNIIDGDNWNTSKTFEDKKETDKAKKFIAAMKAKGLRWGGDFKDVDTPHFDKQVFAGSIDYDCKYYFNQRMISEKQTIPLKAW